VTVAATAWAFFRSATTVTGVVPDRVTSDGHVTYPLKIVTELGEAMRHRTNGYVIERLEQDRRGIKVRYRPLQGVKSPSSAKRFCRAFDEVRRFPRVRSFHHQHVLAGCRLLLHLRRTVTVLGILEAA